MNAFTMRRTLGWFLLEEAGAEGGAGGGGSATPEQANDPQPSESGVKPDSPAPHDGKDGQGESDGEGKVAEKDNQSHRSAFARFAEKAKKADGEGGGDGKSDNSGAQGDGKPNDDSVIDLSTMSDEDWAKAVQPTGDDGKEPDRTFMTAMAKVSRENGVTPEVMQRLAARYAEIEREKAAEADAALRRDQEEFAAKAEAAFDDSAMADIMAASEKYIDPKGMLAQAMRDTVLGSNIELLTILKNLGRSLRSDAPPTTAAAGSSQSADHRLFMRTVPERLR